MLRLVKDSTFHVWWTSSKQQILTFEKLKQRMCRIFSLFLLKSELNKCQNWSCDDWSINQLVIDDFYCRLITLSFVFKGIKDRICRLQLLKCEYFLVSLHYLGLLTVFWHFIDQTTHQLINEIIIRLFDDENNHYSLHWSEQLVIFLSQRISHCFSSSRLQDFSISARLLWVNSFSGLM